MVKSSSRAFHNIINDGMHDLREISVLQNGTVIRAWPDGWPCPTIGNMGLPKKRKSKGNGSERAF